MTNSGSLVVEVRNLHEVFGTSNTRRAGLRTPIEKKRATPHKLRHAFATRMLERGGDLIVVGDTTTQIYTHCSPARLRKLMEI